MRGSGRLSSARRAPPPKRNADRNTPQSTAPRPSLLPAIASVFVRSGIPTYTFVDVPEQQKIARRLNWDGRTILVSGPSNSGKTVAVTRLTKEFDHRWVKCTDQNSERVLAEVANGKLSKPLLVIDDVYKLSKALLGKLARFFRWLADERKPKSVVLIGPDARQSRLLKTSLLKGRIDEVRIGPQSPVILTKLLEQGEKAAAVRLSLRDSLVAASCGSLKILQDICYEALVDLEDDPRQASRGEAFLSKLQHRVIEQLSLADRFDYLLRQIADADRDTETPGGCAILLWLLRRSPDFEVAIADARSLHGTFSPAFDWVEQGGIRTMIRQDKKLAEMFSSDGSTLRLLDPLVRLYLQKLPWLESRYNLSAAGARTSANVTLPVKPIHSFSPFAWGHPNAVPLHDTLQEACSEPNDALILAKTAGVLVDRIDPHQSPSEIWWEILRYAASQRRLRNLLEASVADQHYAGSHQEIRALGGL